MTKNIYIDDCSLSIDKPGVKTRMIKIVDVFPLWSNDH
jgi:hypothetical protein